MTKALFPGSFDPVTLGHIDLIRRAARLFDEVWVGVGVNAQKNPLFPLAVRLQILQESLDECDGELRTRCKIVPFEGLLADFVRQHQMDAVVRGLRNSTDFDYEYSMSHTNRQLYPDMDTIFLMPEPRFSYLSSRFVREAARLGGNVEAMVPASVLQRLSKFLPKRSDG